MLICNKASLTNPQTNEAEVLAAAQKTLEWAIPSGIQGIIDEC